MKVVGVVGASGSGKTTLIERLVAAFGPDARVGTVKSIHHDVELDDPGKDTHRHRTAGASRVVGVTPAMTASFVPSGKADAGEAAALSRALAEFDADTDVVLVEGFAGSSHPKIAVGDPDAVPFEGPVLARVAGGETADVAELVAAIRALPDDASA